MYGRLSESVNLGQQGEPQPVSLSWEYHLARPDCDGVWRWAKHLFIGWKAASHDGRRVRFWVSANGVTWRT